MKIHSIKQVGDIESTTFEVSVDYKKKVIQLIGTNLTEDKLNEIVIAYSNNLSDKATNDVTGVLELMGFALGKDYMLPLSNKEKIQTLRDTDFVRIDKELHRYNADEDNLYHLASGYYCDVDLNNDVIDLVGEEEQKFLSALLSKI